MKQVYTLFKATLLILFLVNGLNAVAQISSGNAFLQGNFVEVGVAPCGSFGTTVGAPAGYHQRSPNYGTSLGFVADAAKDGWATGSPNYVGDYFLPGTPEEGWGLTINGANYNNNLRCGTATVPGSVIAYNNTSSEVSATWQGTVGGISVTARTYIPKNSAYFVTEVTLVNTTAASIPNVYYMRNVDPDHGVYTPGAGGSYNTTNTIVNQNPNSCNNALVTAVVAGNYLGLGSIDSRARVTHGGFGNRSAQTIWTGTGLNVSGTATADAAISIAFNLGTLAPNQSVNFAYAYILSSADLNTALAATNTTFNINNVNYTSGSTPNVCSGGSTPISLNNTGTYTTWSWAPATGLNTTSGTSVIATVTTPTTYTATGTGPCGSVNITITLNPTTGQSVGCAGTITGPSSFVLGQTGITYSVPAVPNATKYTWVLPPGSIVTSGANSNTITFNASNISWCGNITVTPSNDCNVGCSSEKAICLGNVLTTGTVPVNVCRGTGFDVPFTSSGIFNSGNVYTVQLSNASGSFAAPVNIGTLSSNATSGTIQATIPANTPYGSGYRIRVASSNLAGVGSDNGSNISVESAPALTTVSIGSNNANSSSYAKVGDVISVAFSAAANIDNVGVYINGSVASVSGSGQNWVASSTVTPMDPMGLVSFSISYTSQAGCPANMVTSTTNSSSVTIDGQAPAITCGGVVNINATAGLCNGSTTLTNPTVSDNYSSSAQISLTNNAPAVYPIGTTTVTWTAKDLAGNLSTCTQDVTVTDAQLPTITCPSNINTVATSASGAVVNYTAPVGSDNCSGSTTTLIAGLASGSTFPIGTTTNTFKVTDAAGNFSVCSFDVVITGLAPVISCPGNITINAASGTCGTVANYAATETTGIPASTITYSVASGSTFSVGTTTVTATATNAVSTSSCSFDVIVVDNQNPTITCPSNINTVATSAAGATVNYTAPVGTDNCSGSTTTQISGLASGATFPIGTTTNTFKVTDAAGNFTTCSFNVVVSGVSPVVTCPGNITVNNAPGTCGANVNFLATETTGIPASTITYSVASGTNFPVGTTTVTVTATNAVGSSTCTFDVKVVDNEAPVAGSSLTSAPALAINNVAEAAGYKVIYELNMGINNNYDNNPVPYTVNNSSATGVNYNRVAYFMQLDNKWVWVSMDKFNTTLTQLGIPNAAYNNVEWQRTVSNMNVVGSAGSGIVNATGVNGNLEMWHNCYTQGTELPGIGGNSGNYDFNDNNNNNPSCYGSFQVHNYGIGQTIFAYNSWDGGGTDDIGIGNQPTGHPDWTFASNSGSYTTRKLYILVNSGCPSDIAQNTDPNSCGAVVTYNAPTALDNCPGASVTQIGGLASGATFPKGTTTNVFELKDASGNTTNCSFNVTVNDAQLPTITCPSNINTVATSAAGAVVNYTAPVGSDNCSGSTTSQIAGLASGATFPIGTTTNTFKVTDAAGNFTVCSFNVVVSGAAPVINCPAQVKVNSNSGSCNTTVNYAATETAGIPASNITYSIAPGSSFNVGTTQVTATATNVIGTSSCTFNVIVEDKTAPTVLTKNISVNLSTAGTASIIASQVDNGSSDACGIASMNVSPNSFTCANVGNNNVTLTVTDVNGNVQTANAIVTVADITKPVVLTQNVSVNLDATGNASITPAQINNGSSDACGISSMTLNKTNFDCSNLGSGGLNGKSVQLNNSNYVTVPSASNLVIPGNITVEAWFRATSFNGDWVRVVGKGNSTYRNYGLWYHPSGVFLFQQYGGGSEIWYGATVALNQWYHIVGVRDGNTGKLFINGVQVATQTGVSGTPYTSTDPLTIGYSGYHTIHNGQIDEVRVWNYARSNAEIAGNYNKTLNGNESGLVAYYNMEAGSGTAVADNSGKGNNGTMNANSWSSLTPFAGTASNQVTLTVTDVNGNAQTGTATVSVNDNIAPTITCPANISVFATSASGAVVNYATPTATDNCSATVSRISGPASGATFPIGTTTVTFKATDPAGNSTNCSFNVIVSGLAPVINCPSQVKVNANATQCGTNVNFAATETTGIPASTITYSIAPGTYFGVGSTQVTATATNAVGTSTCTFNVIVEDKTAPIAKAKDISVNLDALGAASITAAQVNDGSSDACGVANLSVSPNSFSCANVGTNNVTLTVTDVNGNVSTAPAVVTINDVTAPIAVAKNISVNLSATGAATITGANVNNGSSDACGIASTSVSPNSFTCANVGANNVTLTVTDVNGNVSTAPAVVTINDVTAPIAVAKNISVNLSASGAATITGADVNNGSSDACGIASSSVSPSSFSCANVGTNNVTLTVTDVNGNVSTAPAVVTINDVTAPVAIAKNISVNLSASGAASITGADVNNGSNDACGVASTSVSPSNFTCANVGANNVTLTVTDASGNVSTAPAVVTINDVTAPIAIAKNISVNLSASGAATITGADVNNGSSDACGVANLSVSPSSFSCANVGANNVTLTVTDVNGNVSTAPAVVTINDVTAPIAIAKNISVNLSASGAATITGADVNNGSSDACGVANLSVSPSSFSCANVGANNVTLTVTDVNGNVSTAPAVVTINDVTAPIAIAKNISVNLSASGAATITGADVNNGSSDACGVANLSVSPNSFSCANVGANNVTLTVTDVNGNVSTAPAVVTINDVTAPVAIAKNVTVTLSGGSASVTAAQVDDGSNDACGIASMSVSPGSFNCSNIGNNNVTLTVTDVNGNVSTAPAVVNVVGAIPTVSVSQGVQPGFTQGGAVVLTASSPTAIQYNWTGGPASNVYNVYASGSYSVTVTNSYGCTASTSTSVNYSASSLLSSYTIIGTKEVELEDHVVVQNGGVGVTSANGEVEFENYSTATASSTFVRSPKIEVKQNSAVTTKIFSTVPSALIPNFLYNPYCTGSSCSHSHHGNHSENCNHSHHANCGHQNNNCTHSHHQSNCASNCTNSHHSVCNNHGNNSNNNKNIGQNAVVTITDSIMGNVLINKNATVTFTSKNLYIKDFEIKEGAKVIFAQCAVIRVCKDLKVKDDAEFNQLNSVQVTVYVEKKFEAGEHVMWTGNVYSLDDITVKGKSSASQSVMNGMFIGDEVKAEKYVTFNWNTNTSCTNNNYKAGFASDESGLINDYFDAELYPNPTAGDFTIKLVSSSSTAMQVEVYDMNGKLVDTKQFDAGTFNHEMKADYADGMYLVRIMQGTNTKTIRMVKTQ